MRQNTSKIGCFFRKSHYNLCSDHFRPLLGAEIKIELTKMNENFDASRKTFGTEQCELDLKNVTHHPL
jgi:hypothetical protein